MIALIPMPKDINQTSKTFSFEKNSLTVKADSQLASVCEMIPSVLNNEFSLADNAVLRLVYSADEAKEGYSLKIDDSGIEIKAADYSGALYGLETARQLFSTDSEKSSTFTSAHTVINHDKPAYSWRGLQLDESRHFFGMDTVKELLDFMAMYKYNVFHWHLTDDQGWRIEIKKYPLLTEIGSKRKGTQTGNWGSSNVDETPYGGFYTQDEIREIVEYAKKRGINIVPEIDFPAHCASALAAYNHLACRDIPCEVHYFFGGTIPKKEGLKNWERTLCLGKDEVYQFVYDVIDEVCSLFPFEYFHIGGDEAPTHEWKKCPLCQKKIKDNGLKDEVELQGYFTNKVNEHLKKNNKTLIGWNEILASKYLDRDIVGQYWTSHKDPNVEKHIREGGKIILSCHSAFYFDMKLYDVTTKNSYTFRPEKHEIPKDKLDSVLGYECQNWSEWIETRDELFFKLFTRGLAAAECVWSDDSVKSFSSFKHRIQKHKEYADALGIFYGPDEITMKKNYRFKRKLAKKYGLSMHDFNCEYLMSKRYMGK